MTATQQITQLGSLVGVKGVRIHLTTNNQSLIPDWVEERASVSQGDSGETTPHAARRRDGKFIEEREVALAGLMFMLMQEGFTVVRTNFQWLKGDNFRLGITLERDGVSIPAEHLSDLMELMKMGLWDVRVDRNPPIGRIAYEHVQISGRNRTMRTTSNYRLLGVSDSTIVLF